MAPAFSTPWERRSFAGTVKKLFDIDPAGLKNLTPTQWKKLTPLAIRISEATGNQIPITADISQEREDNRPSKMITP